MSEIKPALTAEEWVRFQQPDTTDLLGDATDRWSEIEESQANQAVYMLEGGLGYRPGAVHGVAARLLDKQPFGFTREDVELVRGLAGEWLDDHHPRDHDDEAGITDLADRIEALLPPEEK